MNTRIKILIAISIGLLGAALLAGVYFGIVSLAESPKHAVDLFIKDRGLVIPILIGFGIQAGLFSALKMKLHLTMPGTEEVSQAASSVGMGAGGTTSTIAMVACCAHHVTDVLPLLGLAAAAGFLAKYQTVFMAIGLGANLVGIGIILNSMVRERKAALARLKTITANEEI